MHTRAEIAVRNARPKSASAKLPCPIALDAGLINFLAALRESDLSGVAVRVLSLHMERLVAHAQPSEAVPVEWIAEQLGVHRNAVGKAYAALMDAGLIQRIEVAKRGAPTRTALKGAALALWNLGSNTPGRVFQSETPRRPTMEWQQTDTTVARPDPLPPQTVLAPLVDAEPAQQSMQPAAVPPEPRRSFPPEIHTALMAKLPVDAKYAAMQGTLKLAEVSSDWGLSDDEVSCLVTAYLTKAPAAPTASQARSPAITPVPTKAPREIARAVYRMRDRFSGYLDRCPSTQTVEGLMDEVAFAIHRNKLGRGCAQVGVRVALSIIAKGDWSTPWEFNKDWTGAVTRALDEMEGVA
jgi:DNA-binding transcriptional ArsR family regulator